MTIMIAETETMPRYASLGLDEFRERYKGLEAYTGHVLREASTDPITKVFVIEKASLDQYRSILGGRLGYEILDAPCTISDWVTTRWKAGFDGENFACIKHLGGQKRRHLRVSKIGEKKDAIAITAHEDYTGWDPLTLLRSHLPQSVPREFGLFGYKMGLRIAGDYESGQKGLLRELEGLEF